MRIHVTEYYSGLYKQQDPIITECQKQYISSRHLSRLSPDHRVQLDVPLGLEEFKLALEGLVRGRTPCRDGFPQEFYSTYRDILAPKLLEVYLDSMDEGRLPLRVE